MPILSPGFTRTWLPILLAGVAVLGLNLGLYLRLAPPSEDTPPPTQFSLPYQEAFSSDVQFKAYSGDWSRRDDALIQLSASGFDLGTYIPIRLAPDVPYQYAADLRYLGGSMGGGLLFNAQNDLSRQASHMARFNVSDGQLYIIYGYFGDDSNFVGQGSALTALPPNEANWHRLGVNISGDRYQVTLDGVVVAGDIPLIYTGGGLGLITSTSQVAFDNLSADTWTPSAQAAATAPVVAQAATETPVAPSGVEEVVFADDFDNPDGTGSLWTPVTGEWAYQESGYWQLQPQGYDLFASHDRAFSAFVLNATFRHVQGKGGGVMFNLPDPQSRNGGHLVRYVDTESFLMWGYFDPSGAFVGQGSAAVADPGSDAHTLSISSDGLSYAIRLDDAPIVEGVPLVSTSGSIALAAAQSTVAFERVEVRAVQPAAPAVDFGTVNGTWITSEGTTQQTDTEATDYFAGTGIVGETYRVSVRVDLSAAPEDAGGGLVFHMSERDDQALGTMVRFANGGREIFWGSYNAERIFVGLGGAPLDLDWSIPHRLTIDVMAGSFNISIDDTPLVNDVPFARTSGWIGLVSFRGPVTFSEFILTMPEA